MAESSPIDQYGSRTDRRPRRIAECGIRPFSAEKEKSNARTEPGAAQLAPEVSSGSHQFYFRAAGYSDRLKKTLVFEGNYIITSPLHDQAASPTDANKQRMPARIVGTVKIQGEPPAHIDAVSVAP